MKPWAAISSLLRSAAAWIVARPAVALGWLVLAASMAPLWVYTAFPSQDGPSHVANAWILRSLLADPAGEWTAFYRLNLETFPNWFTHASLAALLSLLGPLAAEKAFLTACLLAFVASFRFALAALRPGAADGFLLVLPFVFDAALHLGYYNRVFAAVPLLLALGLWSGRRGRLGASGTAAMAALLLGLYFCAAAGLLVGLVGLAALLMGVTWDERGAPDRLRAFRQRLLGLAAASFLPLLLLARFQTRQGDGIAGHGTGVLERLRGLLSLEWLVALDAREIWLSTALAAVLAAVLLALLTRARQLAWRDALLGAAAVCVLVYFAAPALQIRGHGPWGGSSHDRLAQYIPLLLLLWIGAQPLARWQRRLLLVSAVGVSLGMLALRLPRYAELDAQMREYRSVGRWLPRGATLLPLGYAHRGRTGDGRALSERTWPFRHAADWFVAERGVVNLDDYEAEVPFFPVVLRAGYDPYRLLGSSLDRMPACVRLDRFNRLAPRPAEFVLLWEARSVARGEACSEQLFAILQQDYRLVFTSEPGGRAELYRYVGH